EDRDRLALAHLHDGLLEAGAVALAHAAALGLRLHLRDVDRGHVDVEELLDRLADLRLVRVLVHLERVLPVADQAVALFGDDRPDQDVVRMQAHAVTSSAFSAFALPARAWTTTSAASETSSDRAHTTADTSSSSGVVTATCARFRNDFVITSSSSV